MAALDHVEALVAPLLADPERSAILTDFDGTLAPIVDDPLGARPLAGSIEALRALASRFGCVAVVSGRPVAFLLDRFDGEPGPVVLSGLYGLERADADGITQVPAAEMWRSVVGRVADEADAAAPPDTIVERKGLSMVLHVRTAPTEADWAMSWAEAAALRTGLALHRGRMSYELRPPLEADKATAVAELVAGSTSACFLGDDVGDLPAFDALDRLHAATGAHVVRVGVRSAEAPPEILDRADLVVDGPKGALRFLRRLLGDVED